MDGWIIRPNDACYCLTVKNKLESTAEDLLDSQMQLRTIQKEGAVCSRLTNITILTISLQDYLQNSSEFGGLVLQTRNISYFTCNH